MIIKDYELLGFIQGDGNLTDINNPTKKGIGINVGKYDDDVYLYFNLRDKDNTNRTVYMNNRPDIINKIIDLGFDFETMLNRNFPTTFSDWSDIEKRSFVRGMYSANGSVIGGSGKGRITYKTINKTLAIQLKEYLESVGFTPYITTNKSKNVEFSNGLYTCRESYDVNIGKKEEKKTFCKTIGFIQRYKNEKLLLFI